MKILDTRRKNYQGVDGKGKGKNIVFIEQTKGYLHFFAFVAYQINMYPF